MHKLLGSNFGKVKQRSFRPFFFPQLLDKTLFCSSKCPFCPHQIWNISSLRTDILKYEIFRFGYNERLQGQIPIDPATKGKTYSALIFTGYYCSLLLLWFCTVLHFCSLLFDILQCSDAAIAICGWFTGPPSSTPPNTYFPHICDHISTYSGQKLSKRNFTRYFAVKVFNSFKWQMLSYKSRIWFNLR